MKKLTFNYFNYWTLDPEEYTQIILLPTITLYDSYSSRGVLFEWLCWCVEISKHKTYEINKK